ncbi:hypothetical protein bcere0009_26790 [Bacillus cereus R309803]|nr:hypothetical protein bcere0009_26790 [Bacillus cereus R309803]
MDTAYAVLRIKEEGLCIENEELDFQLTINGDLQYLFLEHDEKIETRNIFKRYRR